MTATDVRDRARSLADLPNSLVISSDDELNSLNESYHDVYQFITANDDDYYITETVITLQASYLSPTNQAAGEWWVPLPSDFMSLRYLDYNNNGQWLSIYKAPLSSRNIGPSQSQYRIRGAYLWIFGGYQLSSGAQIRLGYYPTPAYITLPQPTYSFGTSYTPASFQTITEPTYTQYNETMTYVQAGINIYSESILLNTVVAPVFLYTASQTIMDSQYYKGYLYTIFGSTLWRAATNLQIAIATFTTVTAAVSPVAINIYKDVAYITTSTSIVTYTLLGTFVSTVASLLSGPQNPSLIFNTGNIYFNDNTNSLKNATAPSTVIMANVANITSDGTYLYIQDISNNLYQATITGTTLGTLSTIASDCLYLDIPEAFISTPNSSLDQVYLPIITRENPQLLALGAKPPYNFSYPNNLFTELIAYQMAVDFRIKAGQDPSMLAGRLGSRDVTNQMTGLWLRMYQSLKRDDYNPERIANRYSEQYSGIW